MTSSSSDDSRASVSLRLYWCPISSGGFNFPRRKNWSSLSHSNWASANSKWNCKLAHARFTSTQLTRKHARRQSKLMKLFIQLTWPLPVLQLLPCTMKDRFQQIVVHSCQRTCNILIRSHSTNSFITNTDRMPYTQGVVGGIDVVLLLL